MDKTGDTSLAELRCVKKIFEREGRWLKIPHTKGKLIVCGDLHGDCRTLDLLLDRYFYNSKDSMMLFLGDYVDREPSSWNDKKDAVVIKLLRLKMQHPQRVVMLMGNHDISNRLYAKYHSELWDSLSEEEHDFYSDALSSLPIVASTSNGVAFCHAVLPPDTNLKGFDLTKRQCLDVLWADYHQTPKESRFSPRPSRSRKQFEQSMAAFGVHLLVRGHDPTAPLRMFSKRCITIQTNRHYENHCGMHIVIVDLVNPIKNADDIEIVNVNSLK